MQDVLELNELEIYQTWSIVLCVWIASANLSSDSRIIEGLQNSMAKQVYIKYNLHTQNTFNPVEYIEFHDDNVLY